MMGKRDRSGVVCRVAASSNNAMHRMPNPPLRFGFVTGDGGRSLEDTENVLTKGEKRPYDRQRDRFL